MIFLDQPDPVRDLRIIFNDRMRRAKEAGQAPIGFKLKPVRKFRCAPRVYVLADGQWVMTYNPSLIDYRAQPLLIRCQGPFEFWTLLHNRVVDFERLE